MKLSKYLFVLFSLMIAPPLLAAESELSEITIFAITGDNAAEQTNTILLPLPARNADCRSAVSDCVELVNPNAEKGKQIAADRSAGAGNAASGNARNNKNGDTASDRNTGSGGDRGGSSDRGGSNRR